MGKLSTHISLLVYRRGLGAYAEDGCVRHCRQAQKEKGRIREENERIKKKERELKEAEIEKQRQEALERPRILAAKREKLISERNARRQSQVPTRGSRAANTSLFRTVICVHAGGKQREDPLRESSRNCAKERPASRRVRTI